MHMDMLAGGDGLGGNPDDLAILANRFARGDCLDRHLVAFAHRLLQLDLAAFDGIAGLEVAHGENQGIGGMEPESRGQEVDFGHRNYLANDEGARRRKPGRRAGDTIASPRALCTRTA